LKYSAICSWVIATVEALAVGAMIYQQAHASLSSDQQTVTSGTTRVVVVLIPSFTIESMVLGALVGLVVLAILRRRRSIHQAQF
jgi:predicted histidine transporter YuiF (NhaC family)